MDPLLSDALKRGNVVVFFDVSIGGVPAGRIKMELFKNDCPKTVENFRCVRKTTSRGLGYGTARETSHGMVVMRNRQFCTGEYKCVDGLWSQIRG
jgi:hypothetical protein